MSLEISSVESSGTAILSRVMQAHTMSFTPDVARSLLQLQFGQVDIDRMNVLAEKNRQGVLTEAERQELQNYLLVGHLLDLLHAKARAMLKSSTS
jgi:hypothetical protein